MARKKNKKATVVSIIINCPVTGIDCVIHPTNYYFSIDTNCSCPDCGSTPYIYMYVDCECGTTHTIEM